MKACIDQTEDVKPARVGDIHGELIPLPADEVHVWRVSLEPSEWDKYRPVDLLSWDEHVRADRFKRATDRDAYITCRGALRMILSRYTGKDSRMICFEYNQWGRPQIEGDESLRFSVSHSHDAGVIAVTRGREVGVDVERIRPLPDAERIASRLFSQSETAQLKKLPKNLLLEAFYRCWTRKEAFAKALGKGLSLPLDQFSVSLVPDEPAGLVDVRWDPEEVLRWRLHDLQDTQHRSQEQYAGAIAVEGRDWLLCSFTFRLHSGVYDACVA